MDTFALRKQPIDMVIVVFVKTTLLAVALKVSSTKPSAFCAAIV